MSAAEQQAIETWRVRQVIKKLNAARGNGTSMISLLIPSKDDISRASRMLTDEYGTAGNIKSRVNRQSVLSAITSTHQRLKTFNKTPPNGLALYCGTVLTDDNKEKKMTYAFEPFKPLNSSLYLCDSRFHTEPLSYLLENEDKFGFIVVDGGGALYGVVQGSNREILNKFNVELPKKHGRGGQSALRFARLRLEKRHNYLRKVAEQATQYFITNDRPNVRGLIIAGAAEFKAELADSALFDLRLSQIVLSSIAVAYGGVNGFNQAVDLAQDVLTNVGLVAEKKQCAQFFDEITQETGKYIFGVDDTLAALEAGAVVSLMLWDNLPVWHVELKYNGGTETIKTVNTRTHPSQLEEKDENGVELIVSGEPLLVSEWLVDQYSTFGAELHFITDRTQEGAQFVHGFGGIGGILRYPMPSLNTVLADSDQSDSDDFCEDDFI